MIHYLIRRTAYSLLVLLGVNLVTFFLFFSVNTPDDMARMVLGDRHVTVDSVQQWKAAHGYDKPLYFNAKAGGIRALTDTVLFGSSARLVRFDLGMTNDGREIRNEVSKRIGPTLGVAVPVFIISIGSSVVLALGMVMFRH